MHGWFDGMWHGWWWGPALLLLAVVLPIVLRARGRDRGRHKP